MLYLEISLKSVESAYDVKGISKKNMNIEVKT